MSLVVNVILEKRYLSDIYLRFSQLPTGLSGIKISDGEEDPRFSVTFENMAEDKNVPVNTDGGYFLHAQSVCYGVNFFENELEFFIECSSDDIALMLAKVFASVPVLYAYAGQFNERKYQNRVVAKKPYGSHETWVGRDYHRYLPGLYWLNLIPKSLLVQHGITKSELEAIALSYQEVSENNCLIQLYPASSDWEKFAPKIDQWRKETAGVFYKEKALKALEKARTFNEASDATSDWK